MGAGRLPKTAQQPWLSLELWATTDNSAVWNKEVAGNATGSYSESCSPAAGVHQVFLAGMKIILFLKVKSRIPTVRIVTKTGEGVFKIAAIFW